MNLRKISQDEKIMMLAYDQGFEHGPRDFNVKNIDPNYMFDIALHGDFTAVAVQTGVAEKYWKGEYQQVPLIIKLNGKTHFNNHDPVSRQHTSVLRAQEIGASAVGYTIYLGSSHEQDMLTEFGQICDQAHRMGLSVVCWMYPRGPNIEEETSTEMLAYGARVALELGADVVKLKSNRDPKGMQWAVKSAGDARVVIAGGSKMDEEGFLYKVKECMDFGASGIAVGRNVWQHENPLKLSAAMHRVIFDDAEPAKLIKHL